MTGELWRAGVKATKLPGEGRGYFYTNQRTAGSLVAASSWAQMTVRRERERGRRIVQVYLTPEDSP